MVAGCCHTTGTCWGLSSSSPGCLALLSVTQGRTEGPGQGTEAVGAEDGGGLQGTCCKEAGLAVPSATSVLLGLDVGG